MTDRERAKMEKIRNHCGALADVITAVKSIHEKAEAPQKAFIETMIGAAIWYIPKPPNAWTGRISKAALKSFHSTSGIEKPRFSEEHIYPRKVAARLLIERKELNGPALFKLFTEKFGRLHYITPDENKAVIRFQKDAVFTEPETAYLQAGIDLVEVNAEDLRSIKKRDDATIERYTNA